MLMNELNKNNSNETIHLDYIFLYTIHEIRYVQFLLPILLGFTLRCWDYVGKM